MIRIASQINETTRFFKLMFLWQHNWQLEKIKWDQFLRPVYVTEATKEKKR